MSDPAVTAYLTKLLCSNGGRLRRDELADLLDLPEGQIEQILQEERLRFPQCSQLVLAQSSLRICTRYLRPEGEEDEEECPKLHLCRHYLRGHCPPHRRPPCRFSHDVLSDHNRAVLKAKELSGLNEDEIKILLFQNDSQLLPEDCRKYRQDGCEEGEDCMRLHVCSYFTQGGCNRRFCRRSHNLLRSKVLPTCPWLSQKTIQNFQMLCTLKTIEKQQAPREEPRIEDPRDARGMSRGRGRGRPGNMRRAGSQDLLDSRSRDRRNEGSRGRWRSSSRPPSQYSEGQRFGYKENIDNDSDSDHGRYPKTTLDNLMDDWFTTNTAQSSKAQVRSSAGVAPREGTRPVPPVKGSALPHLQPYGFVPFPGSDQQILKVPSRTEQSVYQPVPLTAYSRPTLTTLMSGPKLMSPPPSTSSSTPYSPSREYPFTQPKPTSGPMEIVNPPTASPSKVLSTSSSSLNRPGNLSSGGSSAAEARVSPSLTVSNISEITSTKILSTPNQELDVELGLALDSSMARLSMTPSTPSKASLYSATDSSSIVQPKPATPTRSNFIGASSSFSSSNVSVGGDAPTRNLQASEDPIRKTGTSGTQYSLTNEEFDFIKDFDLIRQRSKATSSTVTQPQPAANTSSVLPGKSSLNQTPEICLTHIWKYCDLRDKCANMHYNLPYRWQVFSGTDWDDLPNMEDIEEAYSDPKTDRYRLIDFQAMKSGFKSVRRLTTPSSVTRPPDYVLTTEWCWYWKNESGTWTEYGQSNAETLNDNILSSDLETIYLSDPTGIIPFYSGNQNYVIDFQEMKQKNLFFMTEREVRRRPKLLNFRTAYMLRGSTKSATGSIKQERADSHIKDGICPPQWDLGAVPEIGFTKVLVPQNSNEFTNLSAMFSKTISDCEVKTVWRVQNSALWELYQWQKDQMKKKNLSGSVDERRLFHSTKPANVDAICSENFDWRLCGTNGIAYGQGSYFAREASYSHKYSSCSSAGTRTMFVARVLVGDFIEGDPTMKRPPKKPSGSQSYDSCVDNVYNPSIFVVFEKHQIYPEYLLEY